MIFRGEKGAVRMGGIVIGAHKQKNKDPLQVQAQQMQMADAQQMLQQEDPHAQLVQQTKARLAVLDLPQDQTMTDEEMQELLQLTGEEPVFQEKLENKKFELKHQKNRRKKLFQEQKELWKARQKRTATRLMDVYGFRREEEQRWPGDIPPDPEQMNKALEQGNKDYDAIFKVYGKRHTDLWQRHMELYGHDMHHWQKSPAACIKKYTGDYYVPMNAYLRGQDDLAYDPLLKEQTEIAKETILKSKLSHTMVTRRSIKFDAIKYMIGAHTDKEAEAKLRTAGEKNEPLLFGEKGFCSTAVGTRDLSSDQFRFDVEIIMRLPKGTSALPISENEDVESCYGEREILLAPGTKFEMLKVEELSEAAQINEYSYDYVKGKSPKWRIYLNALPRNDDGVPAA